MQQEADSFDYNQAFSRTLGWLTPEEQSLLRTKKIAIAGMGGVGGQHLLTHARLGLEQFNIADFDTFELANFNRQAGATLSSLGQPKVQVMKKLALDINPQAKINAFPQGLMEDNFEVFFKDVDLFIDGLDFFALDIRAKAFAWCYQHGIPALTAAPLGLGASLLCFMPNKMSFETYFGLNGQSPTEQAIRFLIGLAPKALHRQSLVCPEYVDLQAKKGPSTPMGCQLSAAITASNSLKVLLSRGPILAAPKSIHFDAYSYRHEVTWRPLGAHNPWLILQRMLVRRSLNRVKKHE